MHAMFRERERATAMFDNDKKVITIGLKREKGITMARRVTLMVVLDAK